MPMTFPQHTHTPIISCWWNGTDYLFLLSSSIIQYWPPVAIYLSLWLAVATGTERRLCTCRMLMWRTVVCRVLFTKNEGNGADWLITAHHHYDIIRSHAVSPTLVLSGKCYYRASSYASAVLGVVILSVRPAQACFVTKLNSAMRIFWYHTKEQSL